MAPRARPATGGGRLRWWPSTYATWRGGRLAFRLLGASLEPFRRAAKQEVADLGLGRTSEQHSEYPAGVRGERVGGAGAAASQIQEAPRSLERLRVPLLLQPADPLGLLI